MEINFADLAASEFYTHRVYNCGRASRLIPRSALVGLFILKDTNCSDNVETIKKKARNDAFKHYVNTTLKKLHFGLMR